MGRDYRRPGSHGTNTDNRGLSPQGAGYFHNTRINGGVTPHLPPESTSEPVLSPFVPRRNILQKSALSANPATADATTEKP